MAKALVIVESPTKARTMTRYLGKAYSVDSCMGHVRDLPKKDFGVDLDGSFTPKYVTIRGKGPVLKRLKGKASKAKEVYLAPDPDREGEAIAWHLVKALNLPVDKVRRITFDEFTKSAIADALRHPGEMNMDLVNAQQARRILDRIVGYKISPLLWRKIAKGLSAGRVQSVAVRLIVEREREIRKFEARPESEKEYWTVAAKLHHPEHPEQGFEAQLRTADKKSIKTAESAREIVDQVQDKPFVITSIEAKEESKHAYPPFSTDLMLRQASVHLRFSTRKTGVVAQQLYEGIDIGEEGPTGLITYMRTDSYHLSSAAIAECRSFIAESFGDAYLPERANTYRAGKGAQEAHEAIRPTDVRRTPESIRGYLTQDQAKLYELIWKRFVACQMGPARFASTVAEIRAGKHTFVARGRQTLFEGHLKMAAKAGSEQDALLPALSERDELVVEEITPGQHFEQPPPRYSEATLVAALKKLGIGRPSTYSAIVSTIQDRKYVQIVKRRFHASALGEVVTDRLVKHFPSVLDVQFTSRMEEELDEIAEGRLDWKDVLGEFYAGFSEDLKKAETEMEKAVQESDHKCPECGKVMVYRFSKGGRFLACSGYPDCKKTLPVDAEGNVVERAAPETTDHKCPECGSPLVKRVGRRGPFLACSAYPKCKKTFNMDAEGNPVAPAKPEETDEKCPKCGKPMVIRTGRRGRFLACSGYPKCKTTKNIEGSSAASAPRAPRPKAKSTGFKCPEEGCTGELVERKGRYGIFYGCSNYPKCKHTAKKLPDPDEQG